MGCWLPKKENVNNKAKVMNAGDNEDDDVDGNGILKGVYDITSQIFS